MSPSCFPSGPLCPHWQPEDSLASSRLGSKGACVQGGNCYSHNESQQGSQCKHIFTKLLGCGGHQGFTPRSTLLMPLVLSRLERCCQVPPTAAVLTQCLHSQGCRFGGCFLPVHFLSFASSLTRPSARLTVRGTQELGAWCT